MKPFDQAWVLLKEEEVRYHPQDEPMSIEDMESYYDVSELGQIAGKEPMLGNISTGDTREDRKKQTKVFGQTFRGKPTFNLMPLAGENRAMVNPSAEIFRRSEMNLFDQAWILLKRVGAGQYELGDFDLNFPHTQGPIVRYHGKHETPETTARIDREGIVPFVDRDNLDEQGRPAGWEGQVGPTSMFHDRDVPDAPLYTSVTRVRDTADDYASGRVGGTERDSNRTPTMYGVRAGALARRQALDAPTRQVQHNALSDFYADRGEYEFIEGGIRPQELHRFNTDGSELANFEGPKTMGLHQTGNSPRAVFDRARQASGFGSNESALQAARTAEAQEQEMVRQWQEQQARLQQQGMNQTQAQPLPGTQTTLDQFNGQGMM